MSTCTHCRTRLIQAVSSLRITFLAIRVWALYSRVSSVLRHKRHIPNPPSPSTHLLSGLPFPFATSRRSSSSLASCDGLLLLLPSALGSSQALQLLAENVLEGFVAPCEKHDVVSIDCFAAGMAGEGFEVAGCVGCRWVLGSKMVKLQAGCDCVPICVYTSSVNAPMNCGVAFRSSARRASSTNCPIEYQSADLRRCCRSALALGVTEFTMYCAPLPVQQLRHRQKP